MTTIARSLSRALLVSALLALPLSASAATGPFPQALAAAAAEADEGIAAFYRARDYAPLWTTEADAARRAAFFAALDGAADQGLPPARYDAKGLRAAFLAVRTEGDRGRLEVAMSRALVLYAADLKAGVIDPHKIDKSIVREIHRPDAQSLLAGFAGAAVPDAWLDALPPRAPEYARLVKEKLRLQGLIAGGGFGADLGGARLEPGATGPGVVALRDRLIALGYLAPTAVQALDGPILSALQRFQADQGVTPDGVVGDSTLAALNTPAEDRLGAVTVALERLRWLGDTPRGARHIWVNQPDFTAKIVDDGAVTFVTRAVIGKNSGDTRTPEFSDEMEHMVINPSWGVPRSIIVKEYLPLLQRNPNAVSHLQVVDSRGRVVPRGAVNFAAYSAGSFPFSMRQPPSDGNALGKVKFMFPNPYNIYLHDTPTKNLFAHEVRAYSHGCIRLGRPFDFAYALLARQSSDPVATFQAELDSGRESTVKLDQKVPVHLVYFTAWPEAQGEMGYRRDIYGRDAAILKALVQAGVVLGAEGG